MKFLKENENTQRYVDSIFSVVNAAKADPLAINATAGCLYDEEGKLFTYNCVAKADRNISDIERSSYASSPSGNKEYIDLVCDFVLDGKVSANHTAIAASGGTGAIYMAVKTCLKDGDTIIYPEISWGNYRVIANENNLEVLTYDVYDLEDLFKKIDMTSGKLFLVINSPCENPLGHAYSMDEWKAIMNKLNGLNREVVLLCDIAYIDYARNRDYFTLFNELDDNVLVLLAASCSKAFSFYGQRLGLLVAVNNDNEFLDLYFNLCSRLARATWSNLNNAGMLTIGRVLKEDKEAYLKELAEAREMLMKRSDLFIRQANDCGLELYTFSDGFFVTLKMKDNESRDKAHQRLLDNHIYTIKVNKGIRVALCSTPLKIVDGLAYKIKELM
ncbi:MAG: aminotransferase class I/II-fold pyridoxal phosphate-dependent enzyme [Erysipelotrichaceae bacterium]|nr:aminotransferase class I/II-fold pyridoxal phosphate-dependent enzyme [Erysipelotrichaceae bacterium]